MNGQGKDARVTEMLQAFRTLESDAAEALVALDPDLLETRIPLCEQTPVELVARLRAIAGFWFGLVATTEPINAVEVPAVADAHSVVSGNGAAPARDQAAVEQLLDTLDEIALLRDTALRHRAPDATIAQRARMLAGAGQDAPSRPPRLPGTAVEVTAHVLIETAIVCGHLDAAVTIAASVSPR